MLHYVHNSVRPGTQHIRRLSAHCGSRAALCGTHTAEDWVCSSEDRAYNLQGVRPLTAGVWLLCVGPETLYLCVGPETLYLCVEPETLYLCVGPETLYLCVGITQRQSSQSPANCTETGGLPGTTPLAANIRCGPDDPIPRLAVPPSKQKKIQTEQCL